MASKKITERKTVVAREYLRVSKADGETERSDSTDRQHTDNQRAVEQQGWELHPRPFQDIDKSASRYSRKRRDGFEALVEALEEGTFGADVLVLWESSRGSRRVGEWVDLVDLCSEADVKIWVTTHGRVYNPGNPRDRRSLLEDAVDSEYESSKTSERLLATVRMNAEAGRVHGKNLYGYRRVKEYDRARHKDVLVKIVEDEVQGPVVREAVRRVIAGESYYQIAKSFNERKIAPRRRAYKEHNEGKGWTSVSIKQMVETPAYRGLRQHTRDGVRELISGAQWPRLISDQEWAGLQARFAADKGKWGSHRSDELKHMLSGVARCGVCGSIVRVGKQNAGRRQVVRDEAGRVVVYPEGHRYAGKPRKVSAGHYSTYICQGAPGRTGFHVAMREEHLDLAVTEAVLARLEMPDFLAKVGAKDEGTDAARAELLAEIGKHRAWLADVQEQAAQRGRPGYYLDELDRVEPLIHAAQRRLEALVPVPREVVDLARSGAVRERWEEMDIWARRRVIQAVVTPVVHRVAEEQKGQKGVNLDRLELVWR